MRATWLMQRAWVLIAVLLAAPLIRAENLPPASRPTATQASTSPRDARIGRFMGPGAMIDAGFSPYYRDRSPRGLAREIHAQGFKWVLVYSSSATTALLDALRAEGLGVGLQLWGPLIYSPDRVTPRPPAEALQVFATGKRGDSLQPHFFCPRNDAFLTWHRAYVVAELKRLRPDLVLVIEAFLGELPGPTSPTYGCVCSGCPKAFSDRNAGLAPPDFRNADSPQYWSRDRERYAKWVTFRAESMAAFLKAAHANVAAADPHVLQAGSMLALGEKGGLDRIRECNAHDARLLAEAAPWDLFLLQAHWPDWIRPDLDPVEHVRSYRPFADAVRRVRPAMPVGILTDSGSNEDMRRSREWLAEANAAATREGMTGVGIYEYAISRFIYDQPPRVIEATASKRDGAIELIFSKRLERASVMEPTHYTLPDGSHPERVTFDGGNIVTLRGPGVAAAITAKKGIEVRVDKVRDDAPTFWFNATRKGEPLKYPHHEVAPETQVRVTVK